MRTKVPALMKRTSKSVPGINVTFMALPCARHSKRTGLAAQELSWRWLFLLNQPKLWSHDPEAEQLRTHSIAEYGLN